MVSIGFISVDVLLIICLLAILIILSYKKGKKLVTALTLSLYPSILFFLNLPYVEITERTARGIFFLIIYIFFIVLFYKYTSNKKLHTSKRKVIDYSLLSVSYVILLLSVYINAVPSLNFIYRFSTSTIGVIDIIPYGLALIIPIVVLFVTSKRDAKD
jgi:uncharacterized membrane protein